MLFGWGSPRMMRRSLPNSELTFLEKFYEDYMRAMYGDLKAADSDPDDDYDHDTEVIVVPASMPD